MLAAGEPDVSPRGSVDELLAQAATGDYVAIQAFIDPAREGELEPLAAARARPAASSPSASGRATCTRPGQLHKGGPNTGLFVQVVDETGDELPIPGRDFGFGRLIRAQAAGDLAALEERGRRVVRVRLEDAMKLGMVGLGRMGSGMTKRLEQHGHEVATYDPNVPVDREVAARAREAARAAARTSG